MAAQESFGESNDSDDDDVQLLSFCHHFREWSLLGEFQKPGEHLAALLRDPDVRRRFVEHESFNPEVPSLEISSLLDPVFRISTIPSQMYGNGDPDVGLELFLREIEIDDSTGLIRHTKEVHAELEHNLLHAMDLYNELHRILGDILEQFFSFDETIAPIVEWVQSVAEVGSTGLMVNLGVVLLHGTRTDTYFSSSFIASILKSGVIKSIFEFEQLQESFDELNADLIRGDEDVKPYLESTFMDRYCYKCVLDNTSILQKTVLFYLDLLHQAEHTEDHVGDAVELLLFCSRARVCFDIPFSEFFDPFVLAVKGGIQSVLKDKLVDLLLLWIPLCRAHNCADSWRNALLELQQNGCQLGRRLEEYAETLSIISMESPNLSLLLEDMEVPEHFLDPISASVMFDPVLLPTSMRRVDRSTISRHFLSSLTDPFTKTELTPDMVKDDDELRGEILEFLSIAGA